MWTIKAGWINYNLMLTSFRWSRSRTLRISRRPPPENKASQVLQIKQITEKVFTDAAVLLFSYFFTFFELKNLSVIFHMNPYIPTAA